MEVVEDVATEPWLYPGTPAPESGLLDASAFTPVRSDAGQYRTVHGEGLDALLARAGAPLLAERTPVVAVGSNASPAVMRRKFARAGVSAVLPMLRGRVSGIAVGHSAHVSAPGYVAAAPFASPGTTTEIVASLVDIEQLAVLDATEPNYERFELDSRVFPLVFENGRRPESFGLYVSRRGVVAQAGHVLDLMPQEGIVEVVADRLAPLRALMDEHGSRAAMGALSVDDDLRQQACTALAAHAVRAGISGR